MKSEKKLKILNTFGIVGTIAAVVVGIYIMIHKIGLIDGLNFGAGAYYYADIPGFEKFINVTHYSGQTPMWALIVLFLIWGAIMYRFWVWVDKK